MEPGTESRRIIRAIHLNYTENHLCALHNNTAFTISQHQAEAGRAVSLSRGMFPLGHISCSASLGGKMVGCFFNSPFPGGPRVQGWSPWELSPPLLGTAQVLHIWYVMSP